MVSTMPTMLSMQCGLPVAAAAAPTHGSPRERLCIEHACKELRQLHAFSLLSLADKLLGL